MRSIKREMRTGWQIWLTAILTFFLAACGEDEKPASAPASSGAEKNAAKDGAKLTVVGFSQVGAESDWRIANTKSMRETFTPERGYKLIFKDAQQKPENQIAALRDFIKQKVDFIVFAPVSEDGWDTVLKEVAAANIPIIIMDRMIKTANQDLFTCWVGSDFRKEGGTAAVWMEKKFGAEANLSVVHLQGSLGSSAQVGRTEGLQFAINRNLGWRVIARDCADFTEVQGKELMDRLLKQYEKIDVVYCENDNMAFGAMKAMDEAGRAYGAKGGITIISFDATKKALEAVLRGQISFNVECNPLHGPRVEQLLKQLQRGEKPGKMAYVEETAFDADTITPADVEARTY